MPQESNTNLKSDEAALHESNPVNTDASRVLGNRTKNKVLRLFTYIEKVLSLNENIERDFRNTLLEGSSNIWLSSLPNNVENLTVRSFNNEMDPTIDNEDEPWLKVKKIPVAPAPELPNELKEWISHVSPIQKPEPKELIKREILFHGNTERVNAFKKFKNHYKEGCEVPESLKDWVILEPERHPSHIEKTYFDDKWLDHPELHKLLDGYTKAEWESWAPKVRDVYTANSVYDQFYALRQTLNIEGDNCELLLAHGLLTWNGSNHNVYSPIFNIPLNLEFTPATKTIELTPDPLFRRFVEISALYEIDGICEEDVDKWATKINENPFDFWHLESLKLQSKTLVNYLSTDGIDEFEKGPVSEPTTTEFPTIWNAPVIYCRKRTNSMWSKYAKAIKINIEKCNDSSTDFISDLVGEYENDENCNDKNQAVFEFNAGDTASTSYKRLTDGELYFPLSWNDEQKRIAEEIENRYGVVTKGPPGTGKTHTIANLISRFLSQGKSVLVVAEKGEPLKVLRDKLPENIRSLAISQLNNTIDRNSVLQQSISEISSNLAEIDNKFSDEKADQIRREIKRIREYKANLANKLRKTILTDSTQTIHINDRIFKPIDAAKYITQYFEDKDLTWEMDNIPHDIELNFTENDLLNISRILNRLEDSDIELHKFSFPDFDDLPKLDEVNSIFEGIDQLRQEAALWSSESGIPESISKESIEDSIRSISDAITILQRIQSGYHKNIYQAITTSEHEKNKWVTILNNIADKINLIGEYNNNLIGHTIDGECELEIHDLLDAISILEIKSKKKGYVPILTKIVLPSNAKKILESYKVDSRPADTTDRIALLKQKISIEKAYMDIKNIINQGFLSLPEKPNTDEISKDILSLELFARDMKGILSYKDSFNNINVLFSKLNRLKNLSYLSSSDLKTATRLLKSLISNIELNIQVNICDQWQRLLKNIDGSSHPTLNHLSRAIETRDINAWADAFESLEEHINKKALSIELRELTTKVCRNAPLFFESFIKAVRTGESHPALKNLTLKWSIARLTSWVNTLQEGFDVSEAQSQIERLSQQELGLNSELITVLAWQRQIQKVTKPQRDALMAWSNAMKKYGKGTGKYAKRWLREAQDALKTAMHAVPVWIMPINRAAQMFSDPKAGMFDVVIFDEASQCDIKGLNICYLGKKILIVGDPDQISPAGIFQDQNKAFDLASRYLHDIPHKNSFSITTSLFDLAKIRIPTMIQLNEHFRCVPQIIAFSNHHVYESKLKPLRYPQPKGLLKPPLVPVFIESGYQNTNNKVNEPEAKAIVEQLVRCLHDREYDTRPDGKPCTFGIISLLATDQAKYIKELINNHPDITEEMIERHQITVGDAYAFQGDERSVIFLSMVKALDPNKENDTIKAITDESAKQRFNVAMTRAKDQVFLFHSFPESILHNDQDWRYKVLKWFYEPRDEELNAGRVALKKAYDCGLASAFSYEVGNLIIDKGYNVIPEYETIGRRIDLVVQGENARLAVECDGDQYHTLEKFDEDYAREQQLRRAGWVFWRITGSSFYLNKDYALDGLWRKLEELGIEPVIVK